MGPSRRRPVVLLQANIHAGEVEGKEAVLALLRTVVTDARPNLLDSLTLIVVPIYNADGNEALGPQSRNRGAQLGPAVVGERANGTGLDLNRDYIKAEAPETRAMLPLLTNGGVDVFVDLHTTNGSYHGYHLTWSPSLHPGCTAGSVHQRHAACRHPPPALERRERRRIRTAISATRSRVKSRSMRRRKGGSPTTARPRFGTNYFGLTGGVSILSEAYSHDPFARRVSSTYAFVRELLGTVGADADDPRPCHGSATRTGTWRSTTRCGARNAQITTRPFSDSVLVEALVADPDSLGAEPGVPIGIRRTGRIEGQWMPVHDRFEIASETPVPAGGWLVEASDTTLLALLARHGVVVRPQAPARRPLDIERFQLDSVERIGRAFQGHQEVRVSGHWVRARMLPSTGFRWVPAAQSQLLVAAQLLEPQSNDGATTWNLFDDRLLMGKYHPVMRVSTRLGSR